MEWHPLDTIQLTAKQNPVAAWPAGLLSQSDRVGRPRLSEFIMETDGNGFKASHWLKRDGEQDGIRFESKGLSPHLWVEGLVLVKNPTKTRTGTSTQPRKPQAPAEATRKKKREELELVVLPSASDDEDEHDGYNGLFFFFFPMRVLHWLFIQSKTVVGRTANR